MKNFTLLTVPALCLLVLLSQGCVQHEAGRPGPVNVVLVSIDTLRADHLSAYGYHRETSPRLDALAREAALFRNAYAHAPFTLISHMSMLTSLFPAAHGVSDENQTLSNDVPTLAEVLKGAGYETVGFYTIPWVGPKFGFSRGFDRYVSKEDGGSVQEAVLAFLQEVTADPKEPFFLFVHLRDVHCGPDLKTKGKPLYDSPPELRDAFLPHPEIKSSHVPEDIWENRLDLTEKEIANIIAQYDGGVLYVDSIIRNIFQRMKVLGLYDESLMVVTSDHGESLGDRNKFKSHGGFWEEGLRVPLIVKLPESHPDRDLWRGVELNYRVQSVDIAPTILGILSIPIPQSFQGQDLFEPTPRDVIAHRNRISVLIRGDYKLTMARGGNPKFEKIRLHDLAADPGEMSSIHEERPVLAGKMKNALQLHLGEHEDFFESLSPSTDANLELDPEEKRKLRALGYLD